MCKLNLNPSGDQGELRHDADDGWRHLQLCDHPAGDLHAHVSTCSQRAWTQFPELSQQGPQLQVRLC